jgi:hypothetical protein
MPIPLAVWAAAGLGAAGIKLYKSVNSSKNIVDNAIARYAEERYKFYKKEEELLPIIEQLGQVKLAAWSFYRQMFYIMAKIINRPGHFTYKSHKNMHLLPHDIQKLKQIARMVEIMHNNKLDKVGTGVLTVVALQGGAANNYGKDAMEEDEEQTILEKISVTPMDSAEYGELEELAVLNAIMSFPPILGNNVFANKDGEKMTKEEALAFKNDIDAKSLLLADAAGKVDRLIDICKHTLYIMGCLTKKHKEQLTILEKLIKIKQDYNTFTLEEKDELGYGIALGINLRELARTDIVLKTGNISVINGSGLQGCYNRVQDLLPLEDLI